MSLFKQRKNKRFNYTSRFEKTPESESFEDKWHNARETNKHKKFKLASLPILLVLLAMALILLYVLGRYDM